MYQEKSICVVVPAYNEETQIGMVIDTMPAYVDRIVIVDDASKDGTVETVKRYLEATEQVVLLEHQTNQGVGGAIVSGYKWARDNQYDVTVVMAGDGQMDPEDLPRILDPVVGGGMDYAKGNRLFYGDAWHMIPHYRYIGNSFLSLITKISWDTGILPIPKAATRPFLIQPSNDLTWTIFTKTTACPTIFSSS